MRAKLNSKPLMIIKNQKVMKHQNLTPKRNDSISQLAGCDRQIPQVLLERARELRKEQTSAEKILWEILRNSNFLNLKFRRQHNIGRYIADFYCHDKLLVIELDGSVHTTQQYEDAERDYWLKSQGFTIIRFTNEQIFNHIDYVLNTITNHC